MCCYKFVFVDYICVRSGVNHLKKTKKTTWFLHLTPVLPLPPPSTSLCISFFRNPHVKDRVCGLWASVADLGPSADLPSGSDPARLHPGADHPRLDDQPAEGMHKYNHTVCVWEMAIPAVHMFKQMCSPTASVIQVHTHTQVHTLEVTSQSSLRLDT